MLGIAVCLVVQVTYLHLRPAPSSHREAAEPETKAPSDILQAGLRRDLVLVPNDGHKAWTSKELQDALDYCTSQFSRVSFVGTQTFHYTKITITLPSSSPRVEMRCSFDGAVPDQQP